MDSATSRVNRDGWTCQAPQAAAAGDAMANGRGWLPAATDEPVLRAGARRQSWRRGRAAAGGGRRRWAAVGGRRGGGMRTGHRQSVDGLILAEKRKMGPFLKKK